MGYEQCLPEAPGSCAHGVKLSGPQAELLP